VAKVRKSKAGGTTSQQAVVYPWLPRAPMETNCIGHILRRNCLLKHVIEGKMEGRIQVTGRRRRKCKQLLDGVKK
jgi:hypothetical protein